MADERKVPGWRVAWKHPKRDHWVLGLYEYRDYETAVGMVEYLRTDGQGTRAHLISCETYETDHGVEGNADGG